MLFKWSIDGVPLPCAATSAHTILVTHGSLVFFRLTHVPLAFKHGKSTIWIIFPAVYKGFLFIQFYTAGFYEGFHLGEWFSHDFPSIYKGFLNVSQLPKHENRRWPLGNPRSTEALVGTTSNIGKWWEMSGKNHGKLSLPSFIFEGFFFDPGRSWKILDLFQHGSPVATSGHKPVPLRWQQPAPATQLLDVLPTWCFFRHNKTSMLHVFLPLWSLFRCCQTHWSLESDKEMMCRNHNDIMLKQKNIA